DGHLLGPFAQGAGDLVGQGRVEAAEQFVAGRQPAPPGLADGLARRRRGQRPAGGRQRAEARAGGEEDVEHHTGGAAPAEVAQVQAGAQQLGGVLVDGGAADGIVHETQASVRGWFSWSKPFSKRSLRSSSPLARAGKVGRY